MVTMAAMQGPTLTLLFFFMVAYVPSRHAQGVLSIPECANRRLFWIGQNNQYSLTCTGLAVQSSIYWSISSPLTNGTEIRLGECKKCHPNCATTNCTVVGRDYAISRRRSGITTLRFVNNFTQNQGALIKCSEWNNLTRAFCTTKSIHATTTPQLILTECNNGVLEIRPTHTVSLTCSGLWPRSNIYWTLTGPSTNHTEVRLADCPLCYPNCLATPCQVYKDRYTISRPSYDVTLLENVYLNDDDTIKCSQLNNESSARPTCTIRTAYQLAQCEHGQLDVSAEEPWTAITCEGLSSFHGITWSLTDSPNQTTELASCAACADCDNACSAASAEVVVSRTSDVSQLRIVGNVTEKDQSTVTCVRRDGATRDSCRLHVLPGVRDVSLSDTFPAAAVGGGIAAALVVVAVVVGVVFFMGKRRSQSWKSSSQSTSLESKVYENEVVTSESAAETGPYDRLQMSDVGLNCEYGALGNMINNTGLQPHAGQPGIYDNLQVSDVGQASTYSVIGRTENTSRCEGGDYEIPS
ncbi:uncharacterized protein [Littorina saxatilis]|uniref:Ig-like domain-containing protein n=1 Tax=Littorina saxatilis TaxID=31220 RepID=A0AAN9B0Q4_9CAEN